MKEEALNTFADGLVMDFNPLSTPNNVLTNCLNGTQLTFNGNEYMLQTDMGNGRVETAYLPSGYVPVGIKEHGGIIYVASYNPLTNKGLIGSFPSPERNFNGSEFSDFNKNSTIKFEPNKMSYLFSINDKITIHSGDRYRIILPTKLSEEIDNENITILLKVKDLENNYIAITDEVKAEQNPNWVLYKDDFKVTGDSETTLVDNAILLNELELAIYDNKRSGLLYLSLEVKQVPDFSALVYGVKEEETIKVLLKINHKNSPGSFLGTFVLCYLGESNESIQESIIIAKTESTESTESLEFYGTKLMDNADQTNVVISEIDKESILNYYIAPYYTYGIGKFEAQSISGTLDLEKLSSNTISLTLWKFCSYTQNKFECYVKWQVTSYLIEELFPKEICFTFYDITDLENNKSLPISLQYSNIITQTTDLSELLDTNKLYIVKITLGKVTEWQYLVTAQINSLNERYLNGLPFMGKLQPDVSVSVNLTKSLNTEYSEKLYTFDPSVAFVTNVLTTSYTYEPKLSVYGNLFSANIPETPLNFISIRDSSIKAIQKGMESVDSDKFIETYYPQLNGVQLTTKAAIQMPVNSTPTAVQFQNGLFVEIKNHTSYKKEYLASRYNWTWYTINDNGKEDYVFGDLYEPSVENSYAYLLLDMQNHYTKGSIPLNISSFSGRLFSEDRLILMTMPKAYWDYDKNSDNPIGFLILQLGNNYYVIDLINDEVEYTLPNIESYYVKDPNSMDGYVFGLDSSLYIYTNKYDTTIWTNDSINYKSNNLLLNGNNYNDVLQTAKSKFDISIPDLELPTDLSAKVSVSIDSVETPDLSQVISKTTISNVSFENAFKKGDYLASITSEHDDSSVFKSINNLSSQLKWNQKTNKLELSDATEVKTGCLYTYYYHYSNSYDHDELAVVTVEFDFLHLL